jgi:transketolase
MLDGPCYLRLGRADEPVVHTTSPEFDIGRAIRIQDGSDMTIIATGTMLHTARLGTDEMERQGSSVRLLSMHTVQPLDVDAVRSAARETGRVFTLEEHSVIGGLGGAVAEVMAEIEEPHAPLRRIGLRAAFTERAGSHQYLKSLHSLDIDSVVNTMQREMAKSHGLVG